MSTVSNSTLDVVLGHSYADDLPELAVAWQASETPRAHLLALNAPLAVDLGLNPDVLRTPQGLGLLTGTRVPAGATPVAQVYAGHQFGGWSPRLGDGRALLLGELMDCKGVVRDLHLKGSGRTPVARGGDGLAAVGPMLREYLISEAMHALGVPTTRALAVVATGRPVHRETTLPGAVLARTAASHLRVGTFQYARSVEDQALLVRLADHAIARHHPGLEGVEQPYVALYQAVVAAQAQLIAAWLDVGFVHGVMNTDNMTISGETIDYGPCAFMEAHDPSTVFSSIDTEGRYAYGNQVAAAEWNLARLAEAMLPLFSDSVDQALEVATAALATFRPLQASARITGMRAKLGLADGVEDNLVDDLGQELLAVMTRDRVDHTSFFRSLSAAARGDLEPARGVVLDLPTFDAWLSRWLALTPNPDVMERSNPVYVPRNHLVEEALQAATLGDLTPFEKLLEVVTSPYVVQPGRERFAEPAPESFGATFQTFCGT